MSADPTITMTIDDSGLSKAIDAALLGAAGASTDAVREVGGTVAATMLRDWPRDTGRSLRAWIEAFNAAGVIGAPYPLPPIRRSRLASRLQSRLGKAIRYWTRLVALHEQTARERGISPDRWPAHRRALKRLERARENYRKYVGSGGEALVIGLMQGYEGLGVRDKVYGGTGATAEGEDGAVVVLINREPHARFIEARRRILAVSIGRAVVAARTGALRTYTASIAAASGLAATAERSA